MNPWADDGTDGGRAYDPAAEVRRDGAIIGLIAAMLVAGTVALPRLPQRVAIHWNAGGQVNGWSSPLVAAFAPPLLALVVWAGLLALPALDPRRHRYAKFATTYRALRLVVVALVAVTDGLTLVHGLGGHVNIPVDTALLLAATFLVVGNLLPRVQPTWFVGIRTPWTLSDDEVWRRTHRLSGRLFMLAALLPLAGLAAPPRILAGLIVAAAVVPAIIAVVYSYVLFSRGHGSQNPSGGPARR